MSTARISRVMICELASIAVARLLLVGAVLLAYYFLGVTAVLMSVLVCTGCEASKRDNAKKLDSVGKAPTKQGYEQVDWINKIVYAAWPSANRIVQDMLKNNVENTLRKAFKEQSIRFRLHEASLGSTPPEFRGVKVEVLGRYDRYASTPSKRSVVLDIDILYNGDSHLVISLNDTRWGVHHVKFKGKLRVTIEPSTGKVSEIGAIHVSFLEAPIVNFSFNELFLSADKLTLGKIKSYALEKLNSMLSARLVHPSKITVYTSDQ